MTGKSNQYDPTAMFQEWIQKSGKAQKEFMNTLSTWMTNQPTKTTFDPLSSLKDMADKAQQAQSTFMDNLSSMQSKAVGNMFSMGQSFSNFLTYSAFKTTVGSSGRISIPEAERDALGILDGDLVQVIVLPINKKHKK